jgi:hypothetical protein
MEATQTDCATLCKDGCQQPDDCQGKIHTEAAADFINNTSLDRMHEIAEAARLKKLMAPPQWILPED